MERHHKPNAAQGWALVALGVVGAAMLGRATWLATHPCQPAAEFVAGATTATAEAAELVAAPPAGSLVEAEPRRLSFEEYAAIAGLCPTALNDLPAEWMPTEVREASTHGIDTAPESRDKVAPPHRLTVAHNPQPQAPAGRLTGIRLAARGETIPLYGPLSGAAEPRIAQAPAEPADGWLVAPEEWFAPEDRSKAATETEPVTSVPSAPSDQEAADPVESDGMPVDGQSPATGPTGATAEPDSTPQAQEAGRQTPDKEPAATPWPVESPEPEAVSPYPDTVDKDAGGRGRLPAPESGSAEGPSFAPPGVAQPATEPSAVEEKSAETGVGPDAGATPSRTTPPLPEADGPKWDGPFDTVVPKKEPQGDLADRAGSSNEGPSSGGPLVDEEPAGESAEELPAPRDEPSAEGRTETVPAPARRGLFGPPTGGKADAATPSVTEEPATAPVARPSAATSPIDAPEIRPLPSPVRTSPAAQPLFAAPGAPASSPHTGGAKAAAEARKAAGDKSADESHAELFAKDNYPSALQCAECHQRAYDEWSVSSHAYAYVSPMFHKFEQTITKLSNGTVGHFCTRCHSPVATAMYEPRSVPLGAVAESAREGVTCIACHRVNQRWGKSNGERRIVPGDIHAPVYGGIGGDGVAEAVAKAKEYKVKTSPESKGPGVAIHNEGRFFDQLTQAEACMSCHQVAVHPGIKLEVVWEQYRASPACKKGVTCQECHMGRVPGVAAGYNTGPVAEINGKTVNDHRRQHNHTFYGPGYSIAHPGVFPQHKKAKRWTVEEWLLFDWRAGWGTDEYEERLEELEDKDVDTSKWFPAVWADPDDRADAREVIEDNLDRLKKKRRYRELVMENGSKVDGPFFRDAPTAGRDLVFDYVVTNLNEGHNLPTASLGAQPQLWANVVLIGPDGRRLWESGYTDSNGDLCDIHSVDVRHGRVPFDKQLFNLQTMFLITGATGTDREFYLPVNLDIDQVAQLRPGAQPISVINHPPFIRMESRSLAALGRKRAKYTVPAELLRQPGRYRLSFRLRNRTEPMYFMRLCESTPEMLRAMTEGTLDIHPQSVEFDVY